MKSPVKCFLQVAESLVMIILLTQCNPKSSPLSKSPKRPNILIALADDQSWLHTSISGDKVIKTPAFDRVAHEGVLFTNSYSACPSCTASRTAIISGQDIWRTKQAGVLFGSIPKDLKIYPHLLEQAGYFVGYTGKGWLPGDWSALGLEEDPIGKEYNSRKEGVIATGIDKRNYSANFNDFLADRPKDKPFCFWFGSTEPHRIYQDGAGKMINLETKNVSVPPFLPDIEKVRSDILDYYYEIEWFDSHLASMLAKLQEIGELDNTIIVVTSDNGMPFPRAKTTLYDWGVHMPLAICWGDKVPGGRVVDDFVEHTDFAPTFLEAAGVLVPAEMTGKSLLTILLSDKQGEVDPQRDRVYTAIERHTWCRPDGATYPIRALRTKDFLYIRNYEPDRWPTGGPYFVSSNRTFHGDVDASPTKSFMVEEDNQKAFPKEYEWCFGKRPAEELYKVADDPGQINNLAHDPVYADIKDKMAIDLQKHLEETGDPRVKGEDPWQAYIYHQVDGFGSTYNMSLSKEERARNFLRPGN